MKCFLSKNCNKEIFRYLITGASVALINLAIYSGLQTFNIKYTVANIFALIISKIYGYFMNKIFVYRSHTDSLLAAIKEIILFILVRGFTGLVDFFGVVFLVEIMNLDKYYSKYILVVFVIVLNYILGKKVVFKKASK